MVSQHPDHGAKPYWLNREYISTDLEWHECFLSFSDLGAGEYKWDWEGKFVDEAVIEKSRSVDFGIKISDLDKLKEDKVKEFLENLSAEDFGKYKM